MPILYPSMRQRRPNQIWRPRPASLGRDRDGDGPGGGGSVRFALVETKRAAVLFGPNGQVAPSVGRSATLATNFGVPDEPLEIEPGDLTTQTGIHFGAELVAAAGDTDKRDTERGDRGGNRGGEGEPGS